jgi:hypothetical protein
VTGNDSLNSAIGLRWAPGRTGEVYRATDTRLDHSLAIKILPPHLALNPECKQRFRVDGYIANVWKFPKMSCV